MSGRVKSFLVFIFLFFISYHSYPVSAEQGDLSSPLAKGQVRALVIGIDNYKNKKTIPELKGAVADALHFRRVFKKYDVADLTVLLDHEATRETLTEELKKLEERSNKNDLVIITFAGHGSQEPEYTPGSEEDGKDEFFLLWGFGQKESDSNERLIDDEIFSILAKISNKAGHVLFLADTCYGGGFSKSVDARSNLLPVRTVEYVDDPGLAGKGRYHIPRHKSVVLHNKFISDDFATNHLPNLTFISGTDSSKQIPEVRIPGEATPRGAASYVLAKAFEGYADLNRDGQTTRSELTEYMRGEVRKKSMNRQFPILEPRAKDSELAVFRNGLPPVGNSFQQFPAPVGKVAQAVTHGFKTIKKRFEKIFYQMRRSGLKHDRNTGDFINENGAVIAYGLPHSMRDKVLESLSSYHLIVEMAHGRSLAMSLAPEDKDYLLDERFQIKVDGVQGRYLILLNLTGDGKVQYLWPADGRDPYMTRSFFTTNLLVARPLGADTMIAIATERRNIKLETELQLLDKLNNPGELVEVLGEFLGPKDRIGLVNYTTRPK